MKLFSLFGEILIDNAQAREGLDEIDRRGEKATGKLDGLKSAAGGIAVSLAAVGAAALAALGVSAVNAADEFHKAMNNLSAQTGVTGDEMSEFEDITKRIYNNNLGESFQDIASTMSEVRRTTMASGEELEKLTTGALTLRDTFDMDVQGSVNTANSLMANFGVTGEEAMNIIAQGAQMGANKNGDLLDTLNEYAPKFQAMGFSAEEFNDILINGATTGAFSIDKVGDAIKEFSIRSQDLSQSSLDAFQSLGLNGEAMSAQFAAGGESARSAFTTVSEALANVKDPLEQNRIGTALFGTQWEDLGATAVLSMANVEAATDKGRNTLEQINGVKFNTFGEAMTGIGRQLETGILIPLGEAVLPLLNKFATWLSTNLPIFLQWFKYTFTGTGEGIKAFGDAWTWLDQEIIQPILNAVVPFIQQQLDKIKQFWTDNGEQIVKMLKFAYDKLKTATEDLMLLLKDVIKVGWEVISGVLEGALDILMGVWEVFAGLFTGDWEKVWDGLGKIVEGVFGAVAATVKGAINLIIAGVNSMIRGLNRIHFEFPSWVPGIGGNSFGINIGEIPMLAKGTDFFKGGLAIVGEQGPELVSMPRGSQVTPNAETRQLLNNESPPVVFERGAFEGAIIMDDYSVDRLMDRVMMRLQGLVRT